MINLPKYKGRVGVFGLGKSGLSTVRALLAAGNKVTAWDDNPEQQRRAADMGAEVKDLTFNMDGLTKLILSPGVPLTHPQPHDIVKTAKALGIPIEGDMDLLCDGLEGHAARVVAITGTNGKSTTTALTAHILRAAGRATQMGGNIGVPVLDLTLDGPAENILVIEVSSYQIDLLHRLRVDVAALTNISPDHLDRHGSMGGYISAKARLFDFVIDAGLILMGVDGSAERGIVEGLDRAVTRVATTGQDGDIRFENGCLITDGEIFDLSQVPALSGRHNAQNAAVAIGVARHFGVESDCIRASLSSFPGLEHRMQIVGYKDHVCFVNDSKATNTEAATHALRAFNNIFWIAGGRSKSTGLAGIEGAIGAVTKAYLIGEAQTSFAEFLSPLGVSSEICNTLDNAIRAASRDALQQSHAATLMLSPACASFDQFANFEARGQAFITQVEAIMREDLS